MGQRGHGERQTNEAGRAAIREAIEVRQALGPGFLESAHEDVCVRIAALWMESGLTIDIDVPMLERGFMTTPGIELVVLFSLCAPGLFGEISVWAR